MRLKRKKEVAIIKNAAVEKDSGAPLSDNPDDATRRLDNIRTREVSLVDSGANGRKFLIVKNADSNPQDDKLFKDENIDPNNPEKTPPKAEAQPPAEPAKVETPPEEVDPDAGFDGGEVEIVKGEHSESATNTLSEVPVLKALAPEQREMFLAMSDALMQFGFGMDMIQADLMTFAMSDGSTGFMGQEIMKGLIAEFGEDIEEARLPKLVEKRGKKMKKARLDTLKGVMGSLESLIKELEDDEIINKGGIVVSKKTEGAKPSGAESTSVEKKEAVEKQATLTTALETVTKAQDAGGEAMETEEVKKALEVLAADKKTRENAIDAVLEKQKVADAQAIIDKSKNDGDQPLTAASLASAVDAAVEKHVKPLQEKIEKMADTPADPASVEADSTEESPAPGDEKVEKSGKKFWGSVL